MTVGSNWSLWRGQSTFPSAAVPGFQTPSWRLHEPPNPSWPLTPPAAVLLSEHKKTLHSQNGSLKHMHYCSTSFGRGLGWRAASCSLISSWVLGLLTNHVSKFEELQEKQALKKPPTKPTHTNQSKQYPLSPHQTHQKQELKDFETVLLKTTKHQMQLHEKVLEFLLLLTPQHGIPKIARFSNLKENLLSTWIHQNLNS